MKSISRLPQSLRHKSLAFLAKLTENFNTLGSLKVTWEPTPEKWFNIKWLGVGSEGHNKIFRQALREQTNKHYAF